MSELQGRRVRLEPNTQQLQTLKQHSGAARWAWNWGLNIRQQAWEHGKIKEDAISLHKLLNSLKAEHYPWLYEVSKCAPQESLRDLDQAYKNWWRRLEEGKKGKAAGAPKFKIKNKSGAGGFKLTGSIRVITEQKDNKTRSYIQLPRIGKIRLSEVGYLQTGKLPSVTIKERSGHWFVSAQVPVVVKIKHGHCQRNSAPEGVDLGISWLATLSSGQQFSSSRYLRDALKKLRKLEKEKSRRKLGSRNRAKTVLKLQKLHARVANQRLDQLHKLTTELATTNTKLVIEDLSAQNMVKSHNLALSLSDAAFGEFRRQLEYKCGYYGCGLQLAPRFYPSTQKCSTCDHVKKGENKLKLSERDYHCNQCGLSMGRDENAAKNLAALYDSEVITVLVAESCSETINACGVGSADKNIIVPVKLLTEKQEAERLKNSQPALISQ